MWEIYLTNEETGVSFESVLEKLAELPPDEVSEAFEDEEKENQWTNGRLVTILKEWFETRDEKDGVIRVDWSE